VLKEYSGNTRLTFFLI